MKAGTICRMREHHELEGVYSRTQLDDADPYAPAVPFAFIARSPVGRGNAVPAGSFCVRLDGAWRDLVICMAPDGRVFLAEPEIFDPS